MAEERKPENEYMQVLKKSLNLGMYGGSYQVVRNMIRVVMDQDYKFNTKDVMAEAIITAIEHSSFELVDGLAYTTFKPNLNTFGKWIPFTLTTAATASVVNQATQLIVKKIKKEEQKPTDFFFNVRHNTAFNFSKSAAEMLLPPWGKYIRTTASLGIGNLGATLVDIPSFRKAGVPFSTIGMASLMIPPMCMVENAIYRSIKSTLRPLALK